MTTQCGNPAHPSGAWHEADPNPGYYVWTIPEQVRRWRRRRRYGCECRPDAPGPVEIRARLILRGRTP